MLLPLHPQNPEQRKVRMICDGIRNGDVIIIPTDTVYAVACSLFQKKAIERLCKVVGKKPEKADLSILCRDLSHLSEYSLPIPNNLYKLMRHVLPGPITFILKASNKVPRLFNNNKKTIGIRVPDNAIVQALLEELDHPLVCASVHSEDEILPYLTAPEDIETQFGYRVDLVIDGGHGGTEGSTVLDCTGQEIEVLREGKGMELLY